LGPVTLVHRAHFTFTRALFFAAMVSPAKPDSLDALMLPLSPIVEALLGGGMSLVRGPAPSSAAAAAAHDDYPSRPGRALLAHVLAKGAQVGACAGVVVAPLWSLLRAQPFRAVFPRCALSGVAAGVAASLAALAAKGAAGALDDAAVDDRAFRLARHDDQNAVDRAALTGAAAGLAAGAVVFSGGARGALAGAAAGAAAALAARAAAAAAAADGAAKLK